MMTKRRKVEPPDDPADCHTIAQKVAYSMRLREIYEEQVLGPGWSSPPSALSDFYDAHPFIESMPWTSPQFCEDWAARERARRAIERLVRDAE
jgi:hypothetical protein